MAPTPDPNALHIGYEHTPGEPATYDRPLGIKTDWLPTNTVIAGQTGSGKSVLTQQLLLYAHHALDGARIVVDGKGDGFPNAVARSIFATQGHLDNVLHFRCHEFLPATPLFDIQQPLASGASRLQATMQRRGLFLELVDRLQGPAESSAKRAREILGAFITAGFDREHGTDQFTLSELFEWVQTAQADGAVPATNHRETAEVLNGLQNEDADVRRKTLSGVLTPLLRMQSAPELTPLLNHAPATTTPPPLGSADSTTSWQQRDSLFRFDHILDQDVTLIIDLSGFEADQQRRLALVLLTLLWRATQRRDQPADAPQNLLAIDEFSNLAPDNLLSEILSEAREFNLSLVSIMQFPEQVRQELAPTGNTRLYDELLADSQQIICGPLPRGTAPAERLADQSTSPTEIEKYLSQLEQGQWLCQFSAGYGSSPTNTHVAKGPRRPPGHPDGPAPLDESQTEAFETALAECLDRTKTRFGVPFDARSASTSGTDTPQDPDSTDEAEEYTRTTTLPTTDRLPDPVTYDPEMNRLTCVSCEQSYHPTREGLFRAISCHSSLESVDRDSIPAVDCRLAVSETTITAADITTRQFRLLQVVHNAVRGRYHPLEFDLVTDSMISLRNDVGATVDDVKTLVEAGYLKKDDPFRRKLYSVTTDGWQVINDNPRYGIDWGHGCGDLEETATHAAMVDALARYIHNEYVTDPDSPVCDVVRYYEPAVGTRSTPPVPGAEQSVPPAVRYDTTSATSVEHDQQSAPASEQPADGPHANSRLDVVGLTASGDVRIAGEAERASNDLPMGVQRDYDLIADQDPAEAIWVAPSRRVLRDHVLLPLAEPTQGSARIQQAYSENTPTAQMEYDTAGMTAVFTHGQLADQVGIE